MNPIHKIKKTLGLKKQDGPASRSIVDLQHFCIIDHILYAEPSAFTSTPQYRSYEAKDFQDVVEHSIQLLDELNLSSDGADVLGIQPGFRALYLKTELAESRVLHKWNALKNRNEILSHLKQRQVSLQRLQQHLDKLEKERAEVDAEE